MKNKLKQFRVNAGMTQSEVAAAAGVTQPSYQRWESGATSIPEAKLEKLATTLNTDPKTLLGRHLSMAITFDPLSAIKIDPPTIRFYSLFALIDSFHLQA